MFMNRIVSPFEYREELNEKKSISIGEDFVMIDRLMDNGFYLSNFDYPFKLDMFVIVISVSGELNGIVNLKEYRISSPSLFILLPEQILQHKNISESFLGYILLFSKKFAKDLLLENQETTSILLAIRNRPYIVMNQEDNEKIVNCFYQLKDVAERDENPYREKIIKNLLRAFLYEFGFHFQKNYNQKQTTIKNRLVEAFFDQLMISYKKEQSLGFYADKLCVTSKHLSKVIKENTGIPAGKWIDDYRVLEAKALLKSTKMTIQQISDSLHFDSQSYFGKFFKRHVGMSPTHYKKKA